MPVMADRRASARVSAIHHHRNGLRGDGWPARQSNRSSLMRNVGCLAICRPTGHDGNSCVSSCSRADAQSYNRAGGEMMSALPKNDGIVVSPAGGSAGAYVTGLDLSKAYG